jgi:hypothetical protein
VRKGAAVDSRSAAGQPIALLVSVLLLLGVAVVGVVAAGPDVLAPDANSMAAPEEPTVPAEEPEEGEESANETYLRDALGSDFEIDGNELIADSADGLPEELTAYATVVVQPAEDDELACEEAAADEAETVECGVRSVTGRGTVLVETASARHSASGSNFGERTVRHLRPDGNVVIAQLSVLGGPSDGSTAELEGDVSDWLASLEEALIAAALDDRMRPAAA